MFNWFLFLFVSVQISLSVMDGVQNRLSTPYRVNVKCFLFQAACLSVVALLLWDMEVTTNFSAVFSFSIASVVPKDLSKTEALCNISQHIDTFNSEKLLAPGWRTTPCWWCVTTYSIRWQVSSIPVRCLFKLQPDYMPCHGDRHPLNMANMGKKRNTYRVLVGKSEGNETTWKTLA